MKLNVGETLLLITGSTIKRTKVHRWIKGSTKTACGKKVHYNHEVDNTALIKFKACKDCEGDI